ncbi:lysozyme inhibitor LprI family protein [Azospirillum sp. TSO22-1]|uniref:lysozyme inhibitor LprI family protein n=1 Tax=Azospirillum sp. TSO22-1 TaxID=716789 RepID=UPI000D646D3C|nr:lysozyme inhibitor LprI family protein [Azospirillum sp. TSO22-1]
MPRLSPITALLALALATPASAASFPCTKAGTPTEKAICADAAVSALDERLAKGFKDAVQRLGANTDGAVQAALKADQKAWLAERNACGADAACLRGQYERRVAVLGFKPDPGAPSPADPFVGRFDHGGFLEVAALRLRDGTLAVNIFGAEPTAGRWICGFEGIGRPGADGALVVGTPDADGNGVVLQRTAGGVRIADSDANRAASGNWCGMNGSFLFDYARMK